MATEEEKTPQQQVKEAIWTYTGWAIVLAACIGAGIFIGYEAWGDAPALRKRITQNEEQLLDLRNKREELKTQVAMTARDRDECRRALEAAGQKIPERTEQPPAEPPPAR